MISTDIHGGNLFSPDGNTLLPQDAEQEEIMRTKFVQVLLEEQWNKLGHKHLGTIEVLQTSSD